MWPRRRLPYVGLPNILTGEFVVPELLQDDATPANLAQALVNALRDKFVRERQIRCFERIYRELRQGAAERAADAVLPVLEQRGERNGRVPLSGAAPEASRI
jgi:lipid-A-disaccharide synthase